MRRFAVVAEPLDAAAVEALVRDGPRGALVTFAGVVRERAEDGRTVTGLTYEAHAAMAEAEFARIAEEARERFGPCTIATHHRVGEVAVGEVAVVVTAAAEHRSAAFEACRYAIDQLKARAPIWKRERYAGGEARWRANDGA